jgi:hypothetical protein
MKTAQHRSRRYILSLFPDAQIAVTQPRRMAAVNLAKRVAKVGWGGSMAEVLFQCYFLGNINYLNFFRSHSILLIYIFSSTDCNNLKEAQWKL